jgi:glycosyltransferase involved in cell wall biosynthesis
VLLEAMAAGVPVVASRVGGTPELVQDGHTGVLVPPRAPNDLAQAIMRLLSAPGEADALGRAAREVVKKRFSIDAMVESTEALYLDLLRQKAARPGWRSRIGLAAPAQVLAGKG